MYTLGQGQAENEQLSMAQLPTTTTLSLLFHKKDAFYPTKKSLLFRLPLSLFFDDTAVFW